MHALLHAATTLTILAGCHLALNCGQVFSEDPLVRSGLRRPDDFTLVRIVPGRRDVAAGVYPTTGEALASADVVWLLTALPPDVRAALEPGVVINQVRVCQPKYRA